MKKAVKVSVVVPVWNQPEVTKLFLESWRKHESKVSNELLIIDNGSDEKTKQMLAEESAKIKNCRIIEMEENAGWVGGVNEGLKQATGDFLCFMNNDIEFDKPWLDEFVAKLESDDSIGIVAPCADQISGIQHEGHHANFPNIDWQEVTMVMGMCCVFRRELYVMIGGLDPRFGLGHSDDIDFCVRVKLLGKRIFINRKHTFKHHCSVTTKVAFGGDEGYMEDIKKKNQILNDKWGEDFLRNLFNPPQKSDGMIAVPHLEQMHARFVTSLFNLHKPAKTTHGFLMGTSVAIQRNDLCRQMLGQGGDWILFLDSDMTFEPDMLLRLLALNKPIAAGLCFRKVQPFNPTLYKKKKNGTGFVWLPEWDRENPFTVDGTGAACLLIRREVLEAIPAPWFEWGDVSEDLNFCQKARKAGFEIWIDPRVKLGHLQSLEVTEAVYFAANQNRIEQFKEKTNTELEEEFYKIDKNGGQIHNGSGGEKKGGISK